MKVSIIIPVYNVESYITECLESVARQTYTGEMECLIVDDCGTDESIKIAEDFIRSYDGKIGFRIIHRKKNGGLSAARNSGTREATGDYVYYLDSDDYIISECIERLVETAKNIPDAEIIQAGIAKTNKGFYFNAEDCNLPDANDDYLSIIKNILYQGRLPVTAWNKLIKRDFLVNNKVDFTEGIIFEDVDFEFKVAKYISHWALCRCNTYVFRVNRKGSITNINKVVNDRIHESRMKIFYRCIDDINEKNIEIFTRAIFSYLQIFLTDTPRNTEKYYDVKILYATLKRKTGTGMRLIMGLYMMFPDCLLAKTKFRNVFNYMFL